VRIKSPLSNLSEIIDQIKESAAQYQETLRRNEAATRAVLIDPVLQALGWDTANIYMVEVEKTLEQTRVDYALYDRNTNVVLVVEAKPLATNLDDNSITMNIIKYAYVYKTKQILLTDGLVWKHVMILNPGDMPIEAVDFSRNSAVDCASFLVQHLDAARFWSDEQTIDELAQRVAQLESSIATLQKQLAQTEAGTAKSVSVSKSLPGPTPPDSSGTREERAFVPLDAVVDATRTAPSFLRLPDGAEIQVSRWRDVLRECCKFALSNNKNIPIPLPDRAGKKVRLLDTVKPPTGISFIQEEHNGKTIYIYVNYDANNCVSNANYILRQAPGSLKTSAAVVFRKI
jgi:predicted type IV restriction endonuclease